MPNDNAIHRVKDFFIVAPDDHASDKELSENPSMQQPGSCEPSKELELPSVERYEGARDWVIKWFGPFFSGNKLPQNRGMGIYLIYIGNYPIYVSSSSNIEIALSRHLVFAPRSVIAVDLLGREILQYAKLYTAPVNIKTGLLFENNKLIHPAKNILAYRRDASDIAFCHALPCNKYARLKYEFEELNDTKAGKFFPLKAHFRAKPKDPQKAAELSQQLYEQTFPPKDGADHTENNDFGNNPS